MRRRSSDEMDKVQDEIFRLFVVNNITAHEGISILMASLLLAMDAAGFDRDTMKLIFGRCCDDLGEPASEKVRHNA